MVCGEVRWRAFHALRVNADPDHSQIIYGSVVLLEQRYSLSDDLAHIRALIRFFLDRRYIRVRDRQSLRGLSSVRVARHAKDR